jgi:hypothetical protein
MKTFSEKCVELINSIPSCDGDMARLAHRLSRAVNKLDAITSQANAQFKAGDTHATFNKQFIAAIESEGMD